jgi:hypothetical protein
MAIVARSRGLFELEEDAQVLADCDRRANQNFGMLDALEEQDAKNQSR